MKKRGSSLNVDHRRFVCLLLTFFLLWTLPGCAGDASAPEFPPSAETVQTVAEKLGWTLDPDGTQSWAEDQILYSLGTDDQRWASVSCALVEGKHVLIENCAAASLPDKPQFAWEDWKDAVSLAETLYGGFSEGEFYQTLSGQNIPEPEIPPAGLNSPADRESLSWEAEFPAGYARVSWSVSPGTVEHNFPSPIIRDWRTLLRVSLYESKKDYERAAMK